MSVLTWGARLLGVTSLVEDHTPKLEDEVTVEVTGQPGARKANLYYLAITTAYGLARPVSALSSLRLPPPGMLMLEYDAADNWVRVTLKYRVGVMSLLTSLVPPIGPVVGAPAIAEFVATLPLLRGPRDLTIGTTGRIPFLVPVPFPVGLPFSGKTVLSSFGQCLDPNPAGVGGAAVTSPNPQPPGDSRSRGAVSNPSTTDITASYLVPMVFSALASPGSAELSFFAAPGTIGG